MYLRVHMCLCAYVDQPDVFTQGVTCSSPLLCISQPVHLQTHTREYTNTHSHATHTRDASCPCAGAGGSSCYIRRFWPQNPCSPNPCLVNGYVHAPGYAWSSCSASPQWKFLHQVHHTCVRVRKRTLAFVFPILVLTILSTTFLYTTHIYTHIQRENYFKGTPVLPECDTYNFKEPSTCSHPIV